MLCSACVWFVSADFFLADDAFYSRTVSGYYSSLSFSAVSSTYYSSSAFLLPNLLCVPISCGMLPCSAHSTVLCCYEMLVMRCWFGNCCGLIPADASVDFSFFLPPQFSLRACLVAACYSMFCALHPPMRCSMWPSVSVICLRRFLRKHSFCLSLSISPGLRRVAST